jgi:putative copper resistance protein D
MLEAGLIASRFLHYAALMLLFGGAWFSAYALASNPDPRLARQLKATLGTAAVVALLSAFAWLAFTTASMSGEPKDLLRPMAMLGVVADTGFGRIWAARIVLSATIALVILMRPFGPGPRLTLLTAALLASLAVTGHGPSPGGFGGGFHAASDAVHLLTAGAWTGAFPPLLLVLARSRPDAADLREAEAALLKFSGVGPALIAALVLSGLVNSWFLVGIVHVLDLASTPYGLILIAKLALFAAMLGLAAANRLRLTPSLQAAQTGGADPAAAVRALRISIGLETALGAAVLATVAWLGTLEPPNVGG